MLFNNNTFAGPNFGYPMPENNDFGVNGYPLEVANDEPSPRAAWAGEIDPLAGLSAAEIEAWWLAPRPEGDASQYLGSTLLPHSGIDPYGFQPEPTSGVNMGERYFCPLSVVNTVINTDNISR